MHSVVNTLSQYTYIYISKNITLYTFCLFLKSLKAFSISLNYEEIKKDLQRITKIKPFRDKYNSEGISFPSEKDKWEKFKENNVAIALNVLYAKKEKICPAYV